MNYYYIIIIFLIFIYNLCSWNKISWYFKHDEFTSFLISIDFWKDIIYNLIINLLISNEYDYIFIFIDKFIKIYHFISYIKFIISSQFTKIFLDYIIRLHEISNSIISNHDFIFILYFWKALFKFLNLDKRLFISFYS